METRYTWFFIPNIVTYTLSGFAKANQTAWLQTSPFPPVKEAKKCAMLKWLGIHLKLELPLSPENENEEAAWLRCH